MAVEERFVEGSDGLFVRVNTRFGVVRTMEEAKRLAVGDLFYLDLQAVDLYGWERDKSSALVRNLQAGIRSGWEFPSVPVVRFNYGFQLVPYGVNEVNLCDGGHHRAVAHYMEKRPLKCRLVENEGSVANRMHIRDIQLVEELIK